MKGSATRRPGKSGPTRKPLMDCDDRPVILLDLFLLERHGGNQGYVEADFDGHFRLGVNGLICPETILAQISIFSVK
jgi:hypothetical protein